jgi:putative ABC transport system permease protein
MNVRESVGIALDALRANRLRSALTLLGVVIGVASVISVMSLVQGLNRYVGAQLVTAHISAASIQRAVDREFTYTRGAGRLTTADADAIERAVHVQVVVALSDFMNLKRGPTRCGISRSAACRPATWSWTTFRSRAAGVDAEDDRGNGAVCVLGQEVADRLFGSTDPVGRDLRIGELRVTVVGVGEHLGSSLGNSRDTYALIPLRTFQKMRGRDASVSLSVRSRGQETFEMAQDETRSILRARRHVRPGEPDDFELTTPEMVSRCGAICRARSLP